MRKLRLTGVALAAASPRSALAAGAGAELIGLYRNPMETKGQRAAARSSCPARAARAAAPATRLRIAVGKRTRECSYRTPVIGRDLEMAATMRLLERDAEATAHARPSSALDLRAGGRRSLPARGLPAAAQDPAAQVPRRRQRQVPADREGGADGKGIDEGERAAAARLQRHQRPRQGQLPDPRLRRRRTGRRLHRQGGRRTAGACLAASRSAPAKNAKGVVGQRRRRRRPGSESVLDELGRRQPSSLRRRAADAHRPHRRLDQSRGALADDCLPCCRSLARPTS